jgi:hypothetical protein
LDNWHTLKALACLLISRSTASRHTRRLFSAATAVQKERKEKEGGGGVWLCIEEPREQPKTPILTQCLSFCVKGQLPCTCSNQSTVILKSYVNPNTGGLGAVTHSDHRAGGCGLRHPASKKTGGRPTTTRLTSFVVTGQKTVRVLAPMRAPSFSRVMATSTQDAFSALNDRFRKCCLCAQLCLLHLYELQKR